jgi:hypothetical protein
LRDASDVAAFDRTIWFLWFQGLASAPQIVQRCYESWVANNPGWNVILLDQSNLSTYLQTDLESGHLAELAFTPKSDLVRLDLLARHGGVWADATSYCAVPLDSWLPAATSSGFFAFRWGPRGDRHIGSWFLAASPSNAIIMRMYEMMLPYWRDHLFHNEAHPYLFKMLNSNKLGRKRRWTRIWFSRLVRDGLGLSPYYAIHYAFAEVVRADPECAKIWSETPDMSVHPPCRLLKQFRPVALSDELRREIDSGATPVYKFTKSIDVPASSAMAYLIGRCPSP